MHSSWQVLLFLSLTLAIGACGDDDGGDPAAGDAGAGADAAFGGGPDAGGNDGGGSGGDPDAGAGLDFGAFDEAIDSFMEGQNLEGLSAVVVHRDLGMVHLRGYGAFDADRVYGIASSSKILSVGVLMRLHDEGVVDIDGPIGDAVMQAWGEGKPELTLAQLVSNSSGLTSLTDNATYAPYLCQYIASGTLEACAETIYTADDAADRIEPDTQFKYGGGQWQLAGGVAAVASGKSWAELVAETYVEPCGTDSLGFTNPFGGGGYPAQFDGDAAGIMPSDNPNIEGGAYVNAQDYGTILLMHLRGGLCGEQRVLSEASVARMQEDRIAGYGGTTINPNLQGYGLGWWVDRDQQGVVVDGGAWGAIPWLDTERGYGAFILMEAAATLGELLRLETQPILESLFDEL